MINPEPISQTIKVLAGSPTPQELAAVVAILEAAHTEQSQEGKKATRSASSWNRNTSMFRHDLTPGFGQWRAQYRQGLD